MSGPMMTRRGIAPVAVDPFDRLFSNFLVRNWPGTASGGDEEGVETGTLAVDVSEDDEHVIVRASLPGFKKSDVTVELHNGVLSITGEHTEETETRNERFYRRERRSGSVSRRLALPGTLGEDNAHAEFTDGVLTVRVPKVREPDTRTRVHIR